MLIRVAAFTTLLFLSACGSPPPATGVDEPVGTPVETVPEWILNLPSEPGVAVYGAGELADVDPRLAVGGEDAAVQAAEQQLAKHLAILVEQTVSELLHEALAPEAEVTPDTIAAAITDGVREAALPSVQVAAQARQSLETDRETYFALVVLPFEAVAAPLRQLLRSVLAGVPHTVDLSADAVSATLQRVQQTHFGEHPPPAPPQGPGLPADTEATADADLQ